MQRKKKTHLILILVLTVSGLAALPAGAQIPEKFENLRVLPKDISRGELIGRMRDMAGALGFRCHGCHVGEPGSSLDGYDFASDEKETKKTARVMLEMVGKINSELLPEIGKERAELLEVSCVTCHHGQSRPRTLEDVLTETYEEDGIDAAIARYRELRAKYYGRATYDFSEWKLLNIAESLAGQGHLDDAHRFLEVNLELHPDFGMNYVGSGQFHQKKGDKEKALAAYEKAKELLPDMAPRIQAMIDQMNGG